MKDFLKILGISLIFFTTANAQLVDKNDFNSDFSSLATKENCRENFTNALYYDANNEGKICFYAAEFQGDFEDTRVLKNGNEACSTFLIDFSKSTFVFYPLSDFELFNYGKVNLLDRFMCKKKYLIPKETKSLRIFNQGTASEGAGYEQNLSGKACYYFGEKNSSCEKGNYYDLFGEEVGNNFCGEITGDGLAANSFTTHVSLESFKDFDGGYLFKDPEDLFFWEGSHPNYEKTEVSEQSLNLGSKKSGTQFQKFIYKFGFQALENQEISSECETYFDYGEVESLGVEKIKTAKKVCSYLVENFGKAETIETNEENENLSLIPEKKPTNGKNSLSLVTGRNLVGFYSDFSSFSTDCELQSIYTYENGAWVKMDTSCESGVCSSLVGFSGDKGYWVKVKNSCELSY